MNENKVLFDLIKKHEWEKFKKTIVSYPDVDVNIRDDSDNYLIQYAILYNRDDIISLLINKGCNLDILDNDGRSLLYITIKLSYYPILKLLLYFNDKQLGITLIDVQDKDGFTPLHYCIIFKNMEAAEIILEKNPDLTLKDQDGHTALHVAIKTSYTEMVKLLLKHGANPNNKNIYGENAVHIACNYEKLDICELLVQHGGKVNAQDYENLLTPLIYAIYLNNHLIMQYLLRQGADPDIQDIQGNNALHHAINQKNLKMIKLILPLIKNYSLININGNTCLHSFLITFQSEAKAGNSEVVDVISTILQGSKVNIQNNKGDSVLHLLASLNIWDQIQSILVGKKCNIWLVNNKGKNVIQLVSKGKIESFWKMITTGYLTQLQNNKTKKGDEKKWKNSWEKICHVADIPKDKISSLQTMAGDKKEKNGNKLCLSIIQKYIEAGNISFPIKENKKSVCQLNVSNVDFSSFIGISLDIIFGLIYLMKKHSNLMVSLHKSFDFINHLELEKYYQQMGSIKDMELEYMNVEITWLNQMIYFPTHLPKLIKLFVENKKHDFLAIPIGIGVNNNYHLNIVLIDKKEKSIERFEPNGSSYPIRLNYNPSLLDSLLQAKMKEMMPDYTFVPPSKFLPQVGFQKLESYDHILHKKIGDAGGYCAPWSFWFVDQRLSNLNIPRDKLVTKLINKIKGENLSFLNLIRDYSKEIANLRDITLKKAGLDINDWNNFNFPVEKIEIVNQHIKDIINQF